MYSFTCNWLFGGETETEDASGSSSRSGDIGETKMI